DRPVVTTFDKPTCVTFGGGEGASAVKQNSPAAEAQPPKKALTKVEDLSENGGEGIDEQSKTRYFWKQDRQDIALTILVPKGTTAKELVVSLNVKGDGLGRESLLEVARCGERVLKGELSHPVKQSSGDDDGELDWEVYDFDGLNRCVKITVTKDSPLAGVTHWWKSALKGHSEIDVTAIAGRRDDRGYQDAWEEAHRQFRERKGARPPPQEVVI
ncbi:unnamed protein product, partial [Chrysoparadoxa australica]